MTPPFGWPWTWMECRCRHDSGPVVSGLGFRLGSLSFWDLGYVTQLLISLPELLLKRNKSVEVFCKVLTVFFLPIHYLPYNDLSQFNVPFWSSFPRFSVLLSFSLVLRLLALGDLGFLSDSLWSTEFTSSLAVICAPIADLDVYLGAW